MLVKLIKLQISCQGLSSETAVVYRSSSSEAHEGRWYEEADSAYSDEIGLALSNEGINFHEVN